MGHKYPENTVKREIYGFLTSKKLTSKKIFKALGAINKFGGVMIADAVGLGKTFTAMAILENLKFHRGLVICPAQLRNKFNKQFLI